MDYLEIIQLRSSKNNKTQIEVELNNLIKSIRENLSEDTIKLYRLVSIDTDFSVHLVHEKKIDIEGSALGLNITASLKKYGLVDHKIWVASK